jgi:RNA methyltransferase, TrmH family
MGPPSEISRPRMQASRKSLSYHTSVSRITSGQHRLVRRFRRLAIRRDDDAVLLDGEHLVCEALNAGVALEVILTTGQAGAVLDRARAAAVEVHETTPAVLEAASPVQSPSGIVAIGRWQPVAAAEALRNAPSLTLGLVDVQDPGNVGAVIRSADALGASAVLSLDGSADPAGWKALRGAMGSTFRLPVARGTLEDVTQAAREARIPIVATVAEAGTDLTSADLSRPLLVLLGREGSGLDAGVVASADWRLTIPMRAGVDSLNVAVAAALVLWEAGRRRSLPGR